MNEPTIRLESRPEVSAFVEKVRDRLADLSDEEREELVGGLEADINELVEDGGSVAELGDPRAYADELRAAAGLAGPRQGRALGGAPRPRPVGEQVQAALDTARRRWLELAGTPALRPVWEVLVALRPLWWVARAWAAVTLLAQFVGTVNGRVDVVPQVVSRSVGLGLLVAAVVVSVQIGRRKVWPGSDLGRWVPRLVLLGLNSFAVLVLALLAPLLPTQEEVALSYEHGYSDGTGGSVGRGLLHRGRPVTNVFPYDAQGRPLTGVQLFDQDGRPLRVTRVADWRTGDDGRETWTVQYPWLNGSQALYNVVPLPVREQQRAGRLPAAWSAPNPPAIPTPPLLAVPPASLPTAEADAPAEPDAPAEAETADRATDAAEPGRR